MAVEIGMVAKKHKRGNNKTSGGKLKELALIPRIKFIPNTYSKTSVCLSGIGSFFFWLGFNLECLG